MIYGPFTKELYDFHYRIVKTMIKENKRIFLVLDGSFYPKLKQNLNSAKIVHRALYKSKGQGDLAAGGPRLINPYQSVMDASIFKDRDKDINGVTYTPSEFSEQLAKEIAQAVKDGDPTGNGLLPYDDYDDHYKALNRIEHIIRLVNGNLQGIVCWCGETLTSDLLYRHLRTLNQILIPKDERYISPSTQYALMHNENMSLKTLRHSDSNVIAQLVNALQANQYEHLLGPAEILLFQPSGIWDNGINELGRKGNAGQSAVQPLHLTLDNLRNIRNLRLNAYDKVFLELLMQEYPTLKEKQRGKLQVLIQAFRQHAITQYQLKQFDHIYDYLRIAIGYEIEVRNDHYMDNLLKRDDLFIDDKFHILRKRYKLEYKQWG